MGAVYTPFGTELPDRGSFGPSSKPGALLSRDVSGCRMGPCLDLRVVSPRFGRGEIRVSGRGAPSPGPKIATSHVGGPGTVFPWRLCHYSAPLPARTRDQRQLSTPYEVKGATWTPGKAAVLALPGDEEDQHHGRDGNVVSSAVAISAVAE